MGYLELWERKIIEHELDRNTPVKDIAAQLHRHISTIYDEKKRGTVKLLSSDFSEYERYCADVGQRRQEEKSHNKGVALKIGSDYKTAAYIEDLIINKKYSPYAVSVELRKKDGCTKLCKATIYRYIYNDVFLNVSRNNLFYNKRKKHDRHYRRVSYRFLGSRSIEQRDKSVLKRDAYGHWELDTVYSGKGKSKACLMVLTERFTRHEIIRKIKDRTASSVVRAFNSLEREYTAPVFRKMFLTVSCDNGVEFADYQAIEKSCITKGRRTHLFFCHPYASCERGSNENANKLIRKYIPKGEDIGKYSVSFVKRMQESINHYPRQLFGGLSSVEYAAQFGIII